MLFGEWTTLASAMPSAKTFRKGKQVCSVIYKGLGPDVEAADSVQLFEGQTVPQQTESEWASESGEWIGG